jgi:hypothetical protein
LADKKNRERQGLGSEKCRPGYPQEIKEKTQREKEH